MAAASSNQQSNDGTGRHLDQDIAQRMVDEAIQAGATYSEVRLVSNQNTSISMRDGQVRNAISGLDVGATLRCLVNGSWGVHSTTDLQALKSQVEATVNLASSVAQRRTKEDSAVELAENKVVVWYKLIGVGLPVSALSSSILVRFILVIFPSKSFT